MDVWMRNALTCTNVPQSAPSKRRQLRDRQRCRCRCICVRACVRAGRQELAHRHPQQLRLARGTRSSTDDLQCVNWDYASTGQCADWPACAADTATPHCGRRGRVGRQRATRRPRRGHSVNTHAQDGYALARASSSMRATVVGAAVAPCALGFGGWGGGLSGAADGRVRGRRGSDAARPTPQKHGLCAPASGVAGHVAGEWLRTSSGVRLRAVAAARAQVGGGRPEPVQERKGEQTRRSKGTGVCGAAQQCREVGRLAREPAQSDGRRACQRECGPGGGEP